MGSNCGSRPGGGRAMRSRRFAAFVVVLVAGIAGTFGAVGVAGAAAPPHPIQRVLILSLPGVGWRDVVTHRTPHLRRLLDGAAIADLSTRAPRLRNRLADNYASLGAGDKAVGAGTHVDADGVVPAGAAYSVDELLCTTA